MAAEATTTIKVYESDIQRILDDLKEFFRTFLQTIQNFLGLFETPYGFEDDYKKGVNRFETTTMGE